MPADTRPTIVLARGCSALGRVLAFGLHDRGYWPVILDSRIAAGPAESRLVDLRRSEEVRREFLALRRERGPAHAVVLLPHLHSPAPDAGWEDAGWEDEAADELLQVTKIVRASPSVLGDSGPFVVIPRSGETSGAPGTPVDAIVQLAVSTACTEVGVHLVRAPLRGREELGRRELADQLLRTMASGRARPAPVAGEVSARLSS